MPGSVVTATREAGGRWQARCSRGEMAAMVAIGKAKRFIAVDDCGDLLLTVYLQVYFPESARVAMSASPPMEARIERQALQFSFPRRRAVR